MYKITLFILLVLFFTGCKNKNVEISPAYTIKIDSLSLKQSIKASELFDTCKNILLETTEESLIGKIDKIQIYENRIYILDKELAKSLFVFSDKGKFLFKIRHLGKGRGEFVTPDDFNIDDNKIYINSRILRKILAFNINGGLISELPVPTISFSFSLIGPTSFFFYTCGMSDLNHMVIGSDTKGKVIENYLPYETTNKKYPGCFVSSQSNFFKTKDGIDVSLPFSDIVYEITPKGLSPKYFIDFTRYTLPEPFIEKNKKNPELASKVADSPYAYAIGNVCENNEWMYLKFFLKGVSYKLFYHKPSKEFVCTANVFNDLYLPLSDILTISGDYLVAVTQPYQLLHKNNEEKSHVHPDEEGNLSATDNPILMLMKFKKKEVANK
jgi:hypothetical protein